MLKLILINVGKETSVMKFNQQLYNQLQTESLKEIDPNYKFTFACTDGCMGSCCMMIDILLDPEQ